MYMLPRKTDSDSDTRYFQCFQFHDFNSHNLKNILSYLKYILYIRKELLHPKIKYITVYGKYPHKSFKNYQILMADTLFCTRNLLLFYEYSLTYNLFMSKGGNFSVCSGRCNLRLKNNLIIFMYYIKQ